MILFPAIDLYDRKAVRLYKGDYNQMTVYSESGTPFSICTCASAVPFGSSAVLGAEVLAFGSESSVAWHPTNKSSANSNESIL